MTHISNVHFEKCYDLVESTVVKCSLMVLDGEPQLSEKTAKETEIEKLISHGSWREVHSRSRGDI